MADTSSATPATIAAAPSQRRASGSVTPGGKRYCSTSATTAAPAKIIGGQGLRLGRSRQSPVMRGLLVTARRQDGFGSHGDRISWLRRAASGKDGCPQRDAARRPASWTSIPLSCADFWSTTQTSLFSVACRSAATVAPCNGRSAQDPRSGRCCPARNRCSADSPDSHRGVADEQVRRHRQVVRRRNGIIDAAGQVVFGTMAVAEISARPVLHRLGRTPASSTGWARSRDGCRCPPGRRIPP